MTSSQCGFRTVLLIITILSSVPIAGDVLAQTPHAYSHPPRNNPTSRQANREFTISYYSGGTKTHSSDLTISQPALGTQLTFERVRFRGKSLEGPLYYGIRGGVFSGHRPWLGFEGEFVHLKVFSDPDQRVQAIGTHRGEPINREVGLGEIVQRFSISHGVNLLLFNVVARHRIRVDPRGKRSRFIVQARFGAGATIPHTESTIDSQQQEQFELGRFAFQLGGGGEVRLKAGLHAIVEYKFTRTRQKGSVFMGESETLLRSHHGIVGLSYHF